MKGRATRSDEGVHSHAADDTDEVEDADRDSSDECHAAKAKSAKMPRPLTAQCMPKGLSKICPCIDKFAAKCAFTYVYCT